MSDKKEIPAIYASISNRQDIIMPSHEEQLQTALENVVDELTQHHKYMAHHLLQIDPKGIVPLLHEYVGLEYSRESETTQGMKALLEVLKTKRTIKPV